MGCGNTPKVAIVDTKLAYGSLPLQFGQLRLPATAGPHPVVLSVHGGFWLAQYGLEYNAKLCDALTDAGWATWNIEYRRIGDEGGGWSGTFRDVAAAADHLRKLASEHGLDLKRVVSMGHSAGGHLALWLAARPRLPAECPLHDPAALPLRAAVSLAGVADLRQAYEMKLGQGAVKRLLGGTPEVVPERYAWASPAELLPLGVSQVLIHGEADKNVPFEMSRAYRARAASLGDEAQLVRLPAAGHFEIIEPQTPEGQRVLEVMAELKSKISK
jgi:acetyl esterase/lipase